MGNAVSLEHGPASPFQPPLVVPAPLAPALVAAPLELLVPVEVLADAEVPVVMFPVLLGDPVPVPPPEVVDIEDDELLPVLLPGEQATAAVSTKRPYVMRMGIVRPTRSIAFLGPGEGCSSDSSSASAVAGRGGSAGVVRAEARARSGERASVVRTESGARNRRIGVADARAEPRAKGWARAHRGRATDTPLRGVLALG